MGRDAEFDNIRRLRLALCDQLEPLTDDQWDTASLCEGWRVREVLGHLSLDPRLVEGVTPGVQRLADTKSAAWIARLWLDRW